MLSEEDLNEVEKHVLLKTVTAMKEEKIPYTGKASSTLEIVKLC